MKTFLHEKFKVRIRYFLLGLLIFIMYFACLFFFNLFLGAISRVETLEQFFARLKKKNNWTDQGKMKAVLSDLRSKEISTVEALKELWEKVKPDLSLSLGMKRSLEEEMKRDALAAGGNTNMI